VIVSGHVHTSEYEDRDGVRRSTLEMRATAVGPDLSRCFARVEKTVPSASDAGPAPDAGSAADPTGVGDAESAPATAPDEGLPLSA
jgi:single-strand DNA-binding protein